MKQDQLSPHRILASRMLAQWATEIHQGGGAPNILAVLERIGDGDQFFHISPGPIFSPMAARADLIIKDIRDHEPRMAMLLIAQALEVSRQRIATGLGIHKHTVDRDLHECFGAFSMGIHYRAKVLREWTKRPRRAVAGDIGV